MNPYDIEGNLVTAAVKALRAESIPCTEMFAGDELEGQRVQALADMQGETGVQSLNAHDQVIRSDYTLTLTLEIVTPIAAHDEHRRLRGIIRSKIALPGGCAWLNSHLAYAEIYNIETGPTQNDVMAGGGDYDELVSSMQYTVHLKQVGV